MDQTSGRIMIANSIVWGNSPQQVKSEGAVTVSHSDVQGGYAGNGNIDADPLFLDPANGDYRLQGDSPCVNAGDPDSVSEETDLDGNPRIGDGRVDMGAYEF